MKTIEERAENLASNVINDSTMLHALFHNTIRDNCIKIATEQREIDIEKACSLVVDIVEDLMARNCEVWGEESKRKTLKNVRKAMEG